MGHWALSIPTFFLPLLREGKKLSTGFLIELGDDWVGNVGVERLVDLLNIDSKLCFTGVKNSDRATAKVDVAGVGGVGGGVNGIRWMIGRCCGLNGVLTGDGSDVKAEGRAGLARFGVGVDA